MPDPFVALEPNQLNIEVLLNQNFGFTKAWMIGVIDRTLAAPPLNPSSDGLYIFQPPATGVAAGQEQKLAWYNSTGQFVFFQKFDGLVVYSRADSSYIRYDLATDSWSLFVGANEEEEEVSPNIPGYGEDLGDNSASSFLVTHNLGMRDLAIAVYRNTAPYDEVIVDVRHTSDNTATIDFSPTVPAVNEYRVFLLDATGFSSDLGNSSSSSFVVSHNLGSRDLAVTVYRNSAPYDEVLVDVQHTSDNSVTIDFGSTVPTANEYRVAIAAVTGYGVDLGNGSASTFPVSHGLETQDAIVVVYRNSPPYEEVIIDVQHTSVNTLNIDFGSTVPTVNEYRAFVAASGTQLPPNEGNNNNNNTVALPTAIELTSNSDVTLTPGVSDQRQFIAPNGNINCVLETSGATNTTFFTIINDDPGNGTISIKVDSAANPTQLSLDGNLVVINAAYTGSSYKFYA